MGYVSTGEQPQSQYQFVDKPPHNEGFWDSVLNSVAKTMRAKNAALATAGEASAAPVTGTLAWIPGGIIKAAGLVSGQLPEATELGDLVQDKLTYHSPTAVGQGVNKIIAKPFQAISQGSQKAADWTYENTDGLPEWLRAGLATGVRTGGESIPYVAPYLIRGAPRYINGKINAHLGGLSDMFPETQGNPYTITPETPHLVHRDYIDGSFLKGSEPFTGQDITGDVFDQITQEKTPAPLVNRVGNPYRTAADAQRIMENKGLTDTHEVIPYQDGYALQRKGAQALVDNLHDPLGLNKESFPTEKTSVAGMPQLIAPKFTRYKFEDEGPFPEGFKFTDENIRECKDEHFSSTNLRSRAEHTIPKNENVNAKESDKAAENSKSKPVYIETDPSMASLPLTDFISKAKEVARQLFSGKVFKNKTDGSEILVPWQGIKHAFSRGPSRTEAAIALKLDEIIESAVPGRIEVDKYKRNTIKAVHHYTATALIDGGLTNIDVVVREHHDGKRYYDHYEIKERPASNISGEPEINQDSLQPIADRSKLSN